MVAVVVGAICVRLKEIYFAFLTLAFQMLLHSLIIAWTPLTGGDQGLTGGMPRPPFLGIRLDQPYHLYLFCAALLVVCLLLMRHIVQSPFGYTLRLIRDNPAAPPSSASMSGACGWPPSSSPAPSDRSAACVMSLFVSGAFPDFAYWTISGEAIFMIMLGGTSLFLGPLAGAVMLLMLNDIVTKLHRALRAGVWASLFFCSHWGCARGLLDYLAEIWQRRKAAQDAAPALERPAARHQGARPTTRMTPCW